jgi:DNA helicase II / ATP-dependent DNA helicase PcrA
MTSIRLLVEPITENDVDWVTNVLHLRDLDESRRDFLMSLSSMDVAACPGSGKTTLIVAKLAILARKWKSRTQGVCVLSDTNVARREIEERLADTDVGHLLLSYPHYIDTIHGFVNRFLAIPWLLSHRHAVTAIDNDIAAAARRRIMGTGFWTLKGFLERKNMSPEGLRLRSANFADPLGDGAFPAGRGTSVYKIAANALRLSAQQGYFCHDEMLLLGEALLQEHPEVATILPSRFPFVLIDEMQDTSARQADLLESALPIARLAPIQRVGDPNQAIFDGQDDVPGSLTFPDPGRPLVSLPNSFRFDSSIASIATGLAVEPVQPDGLQGVRVQSPDEQPDRHVLFLFPDDDTSQLLSVFAAHVATVMDDAKVDGGSVVAVGEVHAARDSINPGHPKFPATVAHYWDGYRPNAALKTARPKELVNCVRAGRALMAHGRSAEGVDIIASGVARLANSLSDSPVVRLGSRPHRALEWRLRIAPECLTAYRSLLVNSAPGTEDTEAKWEEMRNAVRVVVGELLGEPPGKVKSDLLDWADPSAADNEPTREAPPGPNICRVRLGGRAIDVRMSSIHGVKGETHFATLVLETFFYNHAIRSLLPWLRGKRRGAVVRPGRTVGARELRRLRMSYVALTRATHVVCLALPQSALGTGTERASATTDLEEQGWRIIEITATAPAGGGA